MPRRNKKAKRPAKTVQQHKPTCGCKSCRSRRAAARRAA